MKKQSDYDYYGLSKEERELMDWNERDQEPGSLQKALKSATFQLLVTACWLFVYAITLFSEEKGWQIVNAFALTVAVLFFLLFISFHGVKTAKSFFKWVYEVVTYPVS